MANERFREIDEGFMDVGSSIEADAKLSELMQPADRALDDPSRYSEAAAVFGLQGVWQAAPCSSGACDHEPSEQGSDTMTARNTQANLLANPALRQAPIGA